jgi:hypothetical protein
MTAHNTGSQIGVVCEVAGFHQTAQKGIEFREFRPACLLFSVT